MSSILLKRHVSAILQFPIIKQFLRDTINTVLEQFKYPNAANINLGKILQSDGVVHGAYLLVL
jgi:hypothetical protein